MSSCTRISTSVWSSPPNALYFCVRLYSANPQGLHTVCWCSLPQGFVLLCTSVRCEPKRALCGASLQRLCASVYCTSPKSFVRCEPTKTLYSVRQGLCVCALYEPQGLCAVQPYKDFIQCAPGLVLLCTIRAPRALCGSSLQRLCASVYCTSPKSFVRCEPTKALCFSVLYEPQELCAVRAYKDFMLLCTVRAPRPLCGASLQRFCTVCARACTSVYCSDPKSFVRCEPGKALYSVLVLAPQALHRVLVCSCGRMSR